MAFGPLLFADKNWPGFQQAGLDSAEALLYESQIFIPLVDGLSCNLLLGQFGLDDIAPI